MYFKFVCSDCAYLVKKNYLRYHEKCKTVINDDIANYYATILVNSRDSLEESVMKLLSNHAQKVPFEKAIK